MEFDPAVLIETEQFFIAIAAYVNAEIIGRASIICPITIAVGVNKSPNEPNGPLLEIAE